VRVLNIGNAVVEAMYVEAKQLGAVVNNFGMPAGSN
jgi:hypothetical protein